MTTGIRTEPIPESGAWTGADLARTRTWELELGPGHRDDLAAGLHEVRTQPSLAAISRANFPLTPRLREVADRIVASCKGDPGFVVVRGLPVEGFTDDEVRRMYWGLARHMGTCISQDPDCALVADVKEKGIVATAPTTRAYGSKRETKLHVDTGDIVGLMCVRQATAGALSTIASSLRVYNEVLAAHPEWLPALYRGFHWDRKGEQAPWEPPVSTYRIPVFSCADGQVSVVYNRSWIEGAALRRNVPFSDEERAMLDFIDAAALRHALGVEMRPGDAYFANNYTVLHGRRAYEELPGTDEARKRLFLRVWFLVPGFRAFSDERTVRYGISSFGHMGWTPEELLAGRHASAAHARAYLSEPA